MTETDVLLSAGQFQLPEGFEAIREQRRQSLRSQIEQTLALLETGADDDAAVDAADDLWGAMDDPGRCEFLWWCYDNRGLIGRRPFSGVLAETWMRPKWTSLHGWGFSYHDLVKMFDHAVPDVLMSPVDLSVFNDLPTEITAYRGVAGMTVGQARRGMSWTLDRDRAEWFAGRNSERGTPIVLEATICKPNVLAVFDDPEREIVVWPGRVSRVTAPAAVA